MNVNSNQAYKKGFQDFYGRDFIVTPDVLVPRPETESIIDIVKSLAGKPILPGVKAPKAKITEDASILDIGTGSGCIAITLKKELPLAKVTGVDVNESALEITDDYDIVIANLPYVDPEWDWLDKEALSIEPEIALYAEDHGLALIKKLIDQIKTDQPKYLILEADPCQHEEIIKYAAKNGLLHLETRGFAILFSPCTNQE